MKNLGSLFLGLREDKSAKQVIREVAETPNKSKAIGERKEKNVTGADLPSKKKKETRGGKIERDVEVTHGDKIFYPKTGFSKGDVVDYYMAVAPHLLPHLKDRPITLKRYPNGVEGTFFYEKQAPQYRPEWIKTTEVSRADGTVIDYCVINDAASLKWIANIADLELHTFLHKAPAIQTPTAMAFDLDPGPPADILLCCKVGIRLKDLFDSLGLKSFAKTSGSKGLQIYVPLNTPVTYEKTKEFAHGVAVALEREEPSTVVEKMKREIRGGKVLVDWSQNDEHKTTVCVYSLRAKDRPTVSTPVTWDEITSALKKKNARSLVFETAAVLKRLEKLGDIFAPVLTLKQKLPAFKGEL